MTYVDVQSIICKALIAKGIAGGNVFVATETQVIKTLPVIFVTQTHLTGRPADGFFESTVVINCIDTNEYAAGELSGTVLDVLDGFGGEGIADVTHIGTYPQHTAETAPDTHRYAMTFRVIYQNLKE